MAGVEMKGMVMDLGDMVKELKIGAELMEYRR